MGCKGGSQNAAAAPQFPRHTTRPRKVKRVQTTARSVAFALKYHIVFGSTQPETAARYQACAAGSSPEVQEQGAAQIRDCVLESGLPQRGDRCHPRRLLAVRDAPRLQNGTPRGAVTAPSTSPSVRSRRPGSAATAPVRPSVRNRTPHGVATAPSRPSGTAGQAAQ